MRNRKNERPAETTPTRKKVATSVPPATLPENNPNNVHERSYAAHLDSGPVHPQTTPAWPLRHGTYPIGRAYPIGRKEP